MKWIINTAILFVVSLFFSCNVVLLADKRYVIKDLYGYIVIRDHEEITFYPYVDTIDANFLADRNKKDGFRIDYYEAWVDSLAVDYKQLTDVINIKQLAIIPVEMRYYLSDSWLKNAELNTIEYKWNNEPGILRFKQDDWRHIVWVIPRRAGDKSRKSYLDRDLPLHYGPNPE